MHMLRLSRASFAIAAASFAVLSMTYRSFAPGETLPAWIPWRDSVVVGSAVVLLIASTGLFVSNAVSLCAAVIVTYLGVWAAISLPQALAHPFSVAAWYSFFEALTSLVGAVILWSGLPPTSPAGNRLERIAQMLFGLSCVFYGYSHIAYANYTASMVPGWLPGHLGLAYLTGAAHIAAGVGILFAVFALAAAILEATMMSLFGALVWVPSFFTLPRPAWATPAQNQWSELVVSVMLAAAAWVIAASLFATGAPTRAGTKAVPQPFSPHAGGPDSSAP